MALYRTYRPRSFDEIVGQQHAVRTLRNAISSGRVAHAYLFSGPRGSGKTTLARLLACALNATGGPNADFDPADPPCANILQGSSLAVTELDAASHRGIDDVRELRRSAALATAEGTTKVFILDEAHSLTAEASNALLKLLEEPPANTLFVLCTTEADRLLATIRSRCQRFALRRPTVTQIAQALERISTQEGFQAEEGALRLLGRAGQGSFRDAITYLEQVAVATDGALTESAVGEALGLISDEIAQGLASEIVAGDGAKLLAGVETLAVQGVELNAACDALLGWLRLVYLVQYTGEVPAEENPGEERMAVVREHAQALSVSECLTCVDWLAGAQREIREGSEPRVAVEVALFRCAGREQQLPARVERIERALGKVGQLGREMARSRDLRAGLEEHDQVS